MAEGQPRTRCSEQSRRARLIRHECFLPRVFSLRMILGLVLLILVAQPANAQSTGPPQSAPQSATVAAGSPPPATAPVPKDGDQRDKTKQNTLPIWLLCGYGTFLIAFIAVLHLWDSKKAYQFSAKARDELLAKLPDKLSADDLARVADAITKSPDGISGTTRSIVTYSLVLVLAFGIFYLLTMSVDSKATETADKLLTLLSGALTSVIGFYFGTKATADGVAAQKTPKVESQTAPAAHIDSVQPPRAKSGDTVVIRGGGFGSPTGNVEFGEVSVAREDIHNWSEAAVTLRVPSGLQAGKVDVSVNPAAGNKVVAHGLFEVVE